MKKEIIISIGLISLGLVFECLHFGTDIRFFEIKFWLLGIISMGLGVLGIIWFTVVPLLEKRAKTLGQFKKESIKDKSKL